MDDVSITQVQAILTDLYEAYRSKTGQRRVSDNNFAKWLGVSAGSWNYWINGVRVPDLANALIVAERIEQLLGADTRADFLTVLGYPNYLRVDDAHLRRLVEQWPDLPRELREKIYEHVRGKSEQLR